MVQVDTAQPHGNDRGLPIAQKKAMALAFPHSTAQRVYRLIDSCCQPHQQLDTDYVSLDEAIRDAVDWIVPRMEDDPQCALIGVEVRTATGDWRTCRLPGQLISPLLCMLPS